MWVLYNILQKKTRLQGKIKPPSDITTILFAQPIKSTRPLSFPLGLLLVVYILTFNAINILCCQWSVVIKLAFKVCVKFSCLRNKTVFSITR